MKDSSNPTGGGLSSDPSSGARNETGDLDRGRALTSSCSLEKAASPTAGTSVESPDGLSRARGQGHRSLRSKVLWGKGSASFLAS